MMSSFFLVYTNNVQFKCLETKNWTMHSDLGTNFTSSCKYEYCEPCKGCLCIKTRELYESKQDWDANRNVYHCDETLSDCVSKLCKDNTVSVLYQMQTQT